MSIKYNGKTVAGRYKAQVVTNATSTQKGIIRIATDEEVKSGVNNAVAVTPEQLFAKVDKQEGKSLISDTEIERLANVDNYDDTEIRQLILNLDDIKQNKLIAGENVELTPNVDDTVTLNINATEVLTDDKTIVKDSNNIITAVGLKTKTDDLLYDWIGTLEEYELGISNGDISINMRCMITDDEESILEEIPTATIAILGIVKPDGKTISIKDDGTIYAISDDKKQDKLTTGEGISITDDNIISGTIITIRDWSV